MTRQQILAMLKKHAIQILPDVTPELLAKAVTLKDLGADSIDRADIATALIDELGLSIPLVELGKAKDIASLVDLLHGLVSARA